MSWVECLACIVALHGFVSIKNMLFSCGLPYVVETEGESPVLASPDLRGQVGLRSRGVSTWKSRPSVGRVVAHSRSGCVAGERSVI